LNFDLKGAKGDEQTQAAKKKWTDWQAAAGAEAKNLEVALKARAEARAQALSTAAFAKDAANKAAASAAQAKATAKH